MLFLPLEDLSVFSGCHVLLGDDSSLAAGPYLLSLCNEGDLVDQNVKILLER